MENHQGKLLETALAVHEKTIQEIATLLKTTRQTLYNWTQKEKLTHEQIALLKVVGIDIVKSSLQMSNKVDDNELFHLQTENESLKKELAASREIIELQKYKIEQLEREIGQDQPTKMVTKKSVPNKAKRSK